MLLAIIFIADCASFDFPSPKYQRYVLNCEDFGNCEELYNKGMVIYNERECWDKSKPNFVYIIQRRQYCADLEMYLKIAAQKMQNYKK